MRFHRFVFGCPRCRGQIGEDSLDIGDFTAWRKDNVISREVPSSNSLGTARGLAKIAAVMANKAASMASD